MATLGGDAVVNHPFWSAQYVGAGPYRVQQREEGLLIDTVRFEGYALGAPKIPRLQLRFSDDQNVVVAHMLAGEAHAATDSSIGQPGAETLAREWAPTRAGAIFQQPSSWRYLGFQLRPELANPRAMLDLRVRKAIAHALDKQSVSEAAHGGQAIITDTPIWTGSAWGEAMDDSVPTYPLDPRATERLMSQAGFSKGSDGFYRGTDGRLSLELSSTDSPSTAAEILVTASQLQAAGLETQQRVIPRLQAQDGQIRAIFPGAQLISTLMGEPGLDTLASTQIPSDSNRWIGGNRGAWSSPRFDRLLSTFNTTLSHADRVALVRQMLRVYGEELPRVSLYFPAGPFAYVAGLQGPAIVAPESRVAWNVHHWEFK
jgi:peptide/nickel transport system substrate-binding protein